MLDSRVDVFLKIPVFAKLSARQVRKILKGATEDRYDEGTTIVRERGPGRTLFVIMEGTARVVRGGRTIATRSDGDFFGEISVIDGRPRTATVIAETPMRCVVLYQRELKKVALEEPEAAWAMLVSMASRLREL
jgi:CRP/FNR family cyclic AMP-dependent transcriptional regulator